MFTLFTEVKILSELSESNTQQVVTFEVLHLAQKIVEIAWNFYDILSLSVPITLKKFQPIWTIFGEVTA